MWKIAGLGLIAAIAAFSVAIWANSFTKQAQAVPGATSGVSPLELHRQADVKHMPTLEVADPI